MGPEVVIIIVLLTVFVTVMASRYYFRSYSGNKDNNIPEVQRSIPEGSTGDASAPLSMKPQRIEFEPLYTPEKDWRESSELEKEVIETFQRKKRKKLGFFSDLKNKKEFKKAILLDEILDRKFEQ